MLTRLTAAALVALAFASGAPLGNGSPAGTPQNVKGENVGKWQCVAKTPEGESLKFYMEPKNEGGRLSGSIRTAGGGFVITGGTYEKGKLDMRVRTPEGVTGRVLAAVTGAKLGGEWSLSNGVAGNLSCSRAARAPKG